jgi:hypothetical protein
MAIGSIVEAARNQADYEHCEFKVLGTIVGE